MAKAKSKLKFDFKDFLLKRGEYLAMGIAGFFLVILTLWGITKWSSAKDPDKISKDMTQKAASVTSQVNGDQVTDADKEEAKPPTWVTTISPFRAALVSDFPITTPLFDPIAKPDTKRENPNVLPIGLYAGAYQVDLIKGSMKGFDIIEGKEGEQIIAVIVDKKVEGQDTKRTQELLNKFKGKKGKRPPPKQPLGGGMPPGGSGGFGGFGGFGGSGQPKGPGRPGGGPGGGGGGMGGGGMSNEGRPPGSSGMPYGGSGMFQFNSQRVEKALEYIPISQLDVALKNKKTPAMTVIPVRMVTIHAEIPLKRQVEELRRALRLPSADEASRWGPVYDGFEVKRKITTVDPDGKETVLQDWAEYNFEEEYRVRINSLRSADQLEEGFLGYFFRYSMKLALPLPELVTETGATYPNIRLKNIQETIRKLQEASKEKEDPSEIYKRVNKQGNRDSLYLPQGANETGSGAAWGNMGGQSYNLGSPPPDSAMPGGGATGKPFKPSDTNSMSQANGGVDIDHLLLRFVDPAVEPGLTYQYQIRLRMKNPNFGNSKEVSKPADAAKDILFSPWVVLPDQITVPSETYLYAADWGAYTKKIKEEYEKERELRQRLEAKEHQAVVETLNWTVEVRTGEGGKREPVGAWVVADYPVGRGEYIGRKQYVKLPLWSSESMNYILREIPDKIVPKVGGKEHAQPRGWLMDFTSNKSILVDFEGGKVRTRVGGRDANEEVATEMLVLRGDGKLVVKRSTDTEEDKFRKDTIAGWEKWVKEVMARKASESNDASGFAPRPPGPGNP